jgi:hypothetical protein
MQKTLRETRALKLKQAKLFEFLIKEGAVHPQNIEAANELLQQLEKLQAFGLERLDPSFVTRVDQYLAPVRNLEGGLADEEPREDFEGKVKEAKSFVTMFENGLPTLLNLLNIFFSKSTLDENPNVSLKDLADSTRDDPDSPLKTKYMEDIGSEKLLEKIKDNFEIVKPNVAKRLWSSVLSFVTDKPKSTDAEKIANSIIDMTVSEVMSLVNDYRGVSAAAVPKTPGGAENVAPAVPSMRSPEAAERDYTEKSDAPTRRNLKRPVAGKRQFYSAEEKMISDLGLTTKSGKVAAMRNIIDWLLQNRKIDPAKLQEALRRGKVKLVINHDILKKII